MGEGVFHIGLVFAICGGDEGVSFSDEHSNHAGDPQQILFVSVIYGSVPGVSKMKGGWRGLRIFENLGKCEDQSPCVVTKKKG